MQNDKNSKRRFKKEENLTKQIDNTMHFDIYHQAEPSNGLTNSSFIFSSSEDESIAYSEKIVFFNQAAANEKKTQPIQFNVLENDGKYVCESLLACGVDEPERRVLHANDWIKK